MKRPAQNSRDSEVGLLILDSGNRPVSANAEAIRLLAYSEYSEKTTFSRSCLTERIRSIVPSGKGATQLSYTTSFVSGRRHYECRFFLFDYTSKKPARPTVAVLMERALQPPFLDSSIAEQFHLSCREKQAVGLLFDGLTSNKEIAKRMGISPNTVKGFLRSIMGKMGVSTRSAILGKIVQHRSTPEVPRAGPFGELLPQRKKAGGSLSMAREGRRNAEGNLPALSAGARAAAKIGKATRITQPWKENGINSW